MGALLTTVCPNMGTVSTDLDTPKYFSFIGDCLATLMVSYILNSKSFGGLTNRLMNSNIFQINEHKIVQDNPGLNYTRVWMRLQSRAVSCENRDVYLHLLHNKLPVQERLHRIGVCS